MTSRKSAVSSATVRVAIALVVTASCLGVAASCSSSSSSPGPTPGDGTDPFSVPEAGANGSYGTRDQACAKYVAALTAKAAALTPACTFANEPKCPDTLLDFESKSFPGQCVQSYDLGTVDNCVARIGKYTACADFSTRQCELRVKLDPTGKSCPGADAGSDAPADAASDSTSGDASGDSGTDSSSGG